MSSSPLPHIAIFPFMAKGHTIPLLHLAHLIHRRRLATLTFFTTPLNVPFLHQSLADTDATIISLPFPQDIPDLPKGIESTDRLPSFKQQFLPFLQATSQLRPHLEQSLITLPTVNFLISDLFLGWTNESAAKFGIPRVAFSGMGNFSTVIVSILHRDEPFEGETETFTVPDFPNINVTKDELPSHHGPLHEFLKEQVKLCSNSYGLIVNSFYELEPIYYDFWNRNFSPKSWCIGPVCLAPHVVTDQQSDWLTWLDTRSATGRPVLYVAFGTQAEVSECQLAEIALGLERSELDFLWVVRGVGEGLGFLKEMEERVGERGKVVRGWVDQASVLGHGGVKGFLSHCGWNSVIEGISAGVPILAWPMMAEQHLNAKLVVEELGVGLRILKSDRDGLVSGRDVGVMARRLILGEEGKKAAEKVRVLADAARRAMDVGGSSWHTLEMMIAEVCAKEEAIENVCPQNLRGCMP